MKKYMGDEKLLPREKKGAAADQKNAKISC
jgi:hypothetical protein